MSPAHLRQMSGELGTSGIDFRRLSAAIHCWEARFPIRRRRWEARFPIRRRRTCSYQQTLKRRYRPALDAAVMPHFRRILVWVTARTRRTGINRVRRSVNDVYAPSVCHPTGDIDGERFVSRETPVMFLLECVLFNCSEPDFAMPRIPLRSCRAGHRFRASRTHGVPGP